MKKTFLLIIFFSALLLVSKTVIAQDHTNILVVSTFYLDMPEDGSRSEFDSLSVIINDKVISKNSKVISRYIVRHQWGSDSRQVVVMTEYANMADIDLADAEGTKIFNQVFTTKEEREAFGSKYRKYWNGHHSDEIYSVIAKK